MIQDSDRAQILDIVVVRHWLPSLGAENRVGLTEVRSYEKEITDETRPPFRSISTH
jgi:hypothetical protein